MYSIMPIVIKTDLPIMFSYDLGQFWMAMYIFQVIGMVNAASNNSSLDILAVSLIGIGCAQIDILNEKLKKLFHNSMKKEFDGYIQDDQSVRDCVRHHIQIIRCTSQIENSELLPIDVSSKPRDIDKQMDKSKVCYDWPTKRVPDLMIADGVIFKKKEGGRLRSILAPEYQDAVYCGSSVYISEDMNDCYQFNDDPYQEHYLLRSSETPYILLYSHDDESDLPPSLLD
ncbi:unnamed protein product [Phaedon cochleariae]|uniref:Odorant receptor n=1 Tax=Phaedon cochleariae TaxID=80249 RepID=A0A9N9SCY9_PHACE|nr:unnamed protein product [Phaedon cochleariae]